MENLETMLFDAAARGCTNSLQKLLKNDPLILDRVLVNRFCETPLHVAAMLGHVDFVKEIIRIRPQLANELNSQKSSPLHLASAKGHNHVVRALLSVDSPPCQACNKNGLTPLHLAAMKGRVEVMKMLLQAQPEAAKLSVYGGENILHLCVKHYQLEALKLLVETVGEPQFINSRDTDGNTILHLAVADKQVETIKFLLTVAGLEVNARNLEGMTAMDVLIQSRRDVRDALIKESLEHAGRIGTWETNIPNSMNQNMETQALSPHHGQPTSSTNMPNNSSDRPLKKQDKWFEKKKNALMVVASLIATMAFQVGVNPPGGVWQDEDDKSPNSDRAGTSILANKYPTDFGIFHIFNTTGFIASLSIILLLMSGLPLRRKLFMWILMVITWIAISAIAIAYILSIVVLIPSYENKVALRVVVVSIIVWLCLMALLLIGHTIRLIVKAVKKLTKKRTDTGSAVPENNVAPLESVQSI